jgi:hypothetical protein
MTQPPDTIEAALAEHLDRTSAQLELNVLTVVVRPLAHWHVEDHYTGESRTYRDRRLMQQWVRRHGGLGIVVIEECDESRCQEARP